MNIKRYKGLVIGLLIVVLFSYPITTAIASSEPNGYVINEATLYSGPSYNASGYTTLSAGTEICVYGQYHQWYEVGWNGKTGYVLSEYVSIDHEQDYTIIIDATPVPIAPVTTPFNKPMEPALSEPTTAPTPTPTPSGDTSIVESAEVYRGVPYKWGGTTDKGMDCSGFVQKAYEDAGYSIGRTTQLQAREGKEVETYAPGDILCFGRSRWNIVHTGIYIGDGKFIHSSSPEGVIVSELDVYGLNLVMARRLS
jgi:cell wall-associated NlpC family hydrolase